MNLFVSKVTIEIGEPLPSPKVQTDVIVDDPKIAVGDDRIRRSALQSWPYVATIHNHATQTCREKKEIAFVKKQLLPCTPFPKNWEKLLTE